MKDSQRRTSPVTFLFFNDTATTEIYTLSLHDALPILRSEAGPAMHTPLALFQADHVQRSEEHTSELQSPYVISYAVFCWKKQTNTILYLDHGQLYLLVNLFVVLVS